MGIYRHLVCLAVCVVAIAGCRRDASAGDSGSAINEQLVLWATVVGSIAALPALIEFIVERRKRRERLALSLDDERVATLNAQVAGLEGMLDDIADLIDRARHPTDYASVRAGNEILILAGNLSGKKALARVIAQRAEMERLITVYNPRNADALAKARSLVMHYDLTKVMLLLSNLDMAFTQGDEDVMAELDALIERTSAAPNVLVVGTALSLEPNSPLDNAFGVKLVLPGTSRSAAVRTETSGPAGEEMRQFLSTVIQHYLGEADRSGFVLQGLTITSLIARLLEVVTNPAEIQDIVALCETTAIYRNKRLNVPQLAITSEILETAIRRVITGKVVGSGSAERAV